MLCFVVQCSEVQSHSCTSFCFSAQRILSHSSHCAIYSIVSILTGLGQFHVHRAGRLGIGMRLVFSRWDSSEITIYVIAGSDMLSVSDEWKNGVIEPSLLQAIVVWNVHPPFLLLSNHAHHVLLTWLICTWPNVTLTHITPSGHDRMFGGRCEGRVGAGSSALRTAATLRRWCLWLICYYVISYDEAYT